MTTFSTSDRALDHYVAEINQYPLLTRGEEVQLAELYQREGLKSAAHRLVVCNLRFVVKTAHEYRGYGLKLLDLIQEGNMGLVIAVEKFDPKKGYRLVSYAVWWIRAYIQSFIMRAWSLVKVGTTQAQRKLFFKLRSERERADRRAGPGRHATALSIAHRLRVDEHDVTHMELRLAERDFSLDSRAMEGSRNTHMDLLGNDEGAESQEDRYASRQLIALLWRTIHAIFDQLSDKEQYVITNRILCDEPPTLQEIGCHLNISRERVRQIESNIIRKLRVCICQGDTLSLAA